MKIFFRFTKIRYFIKAMMWPNLKKISRIGRFKKIFEGRGGSDEKLSVMCLGREFVVVGLPVPSMSLSLHYLNQNKGYHFPVLWNCTAYALMYSFSYLSIKWTHIFFKGVAGNVWYLNLECRIVEHFFSKIVDRNLFRCLETYFCQSIYQC